MGTYCLILHLDTVSGATHSDLVIALLWKEGLAKVLLQMPLFVGSQKKETGTIVAVRQRCTVNSA